MRRTLVLASFLFLAACGGSENKAVDTATLGPLTGREQSILIAADNAARQGNFEAAEKDYMSAISASTGHVEAHTRLAQLYLLNKQPQKARQVLERARELQPNNGGVNYLLGKIDLSAGNYEAARDAFRRGLTTNPENLDLVNGAGIAEDMLGNHSAAQALYVPAITRAKGKADVTALRTNLAMSYLLTGDHKRALPILKDEAKKNSSVTIRHNLALAYGLAGDAKAARAALKGESDEPTRIATLARLKEYIADRDPAKKPPILSPKQAPAPDGE